MYEIIHTKAIIFLERRDKEYDKVFFIFSEVLGLTSVSAPGILKPMAKLNSLLQPFRIVTCDIVVGKSTKKITTVIETQPFEIIFKNRYTKKSILRVFEFITLMIPRNISVPEIYVLFEKYIYRLMVCTPADDLKRLELNMLYYMLLQLGYIDHDKTVALSNNDYFWTDYSVETYKILLHRVNTSLKEIHT